MNYCYQKSPYIIWDGSNLSAVEEYFAANLSGGGNFHVTAEGDQLHLNRFGQQFVLSPGMAMVTTWPNVMTAEEFAAQYNTIPDA
jgi:hypothetical protein